MQTDGLPSSLPDLRPIAPYGGVLRQLLVPSGQAIELAAASLNWTSWTLTPRQLCDLELLLNGGFSPLVGFLGQADFDSVCREMRLMDGTLWPIPLTLDVTPALAAGLHPGQPLALRDAEGVLLAVLHIEDVWEIDRAAKAQSVYGTLDQRHPGVAHLFQRTNTVGVGGRLEGLRLPLAYDFPDLRQTPAQLRALFARRGWQRIVAFQTRNPLHRAHHALTLRAAQQQQANLLIHPAVGLTRPGDVDHYTRVRCYQAVLPQYPPGLALLALLPLAMRMGGPREALLHGILRQNYGCTHLIVGRDHAGPGLDSVGRPFYPPYAAQQLYARHQSELGVQMIPFRDLVYVEDLQAHVPEDEAPAGARTLSLSGTELRRRLAHGLEIPDWFSFPEVTRQLRRSYPPRSQQGFSVFFTGLSGAGKSTLAQALLARLMEDGGRPVSLLDGDLVRQELSSELGFSPQHRDLNIRRIGYVASEIVKNRGIALCAPIAPYDRTRREVRQRIEAWGGFVLVHVATPLTICEQRDRKGLYAKARAGMIENFTGISDVYEEPTDAELVLDTTAVLPQQAAQRILDFLVQQGYLAPPEAAL